MNQIQKADFIDRVQAVTELYLTRRRRDKRVKKEKQKAKNVILDWLGAFVWAAGVVLLINQYLVQAYTIPSGSMINTLLIGDRIFVNKLIYGPELLPAMFKLPSPIKPQRNEVIIFENPSHISRGTAFSIAQRIIYMLTLSMVDIDRDEFGEPRAQFLIKRAAGMGGDHFVLDKGDFLIRFSGENRWVRERDFNNGRNFNHEISRLMELNSYPPLASAGRASAYNDLSFNHQINTSALNSQLANIRFPDQLAYERARLEVLRASQPFNNRYGILLARHTQGWYIPEGRILTLGDNRDNSRDGRFYGPIEESKVLGKGFIIYWPLFGGRMGFIR